jgi:hypothetical protein
MCLVINNNRVRGTSYKLAPAWIVSEADRYLHSSARDYLGTKGVLDVEILERPMSLEGYVFSY